MTALNGNAFDELCTSYDEAYEEVEKYLNTYGQLMGNLMTDFQVYLQCPSGRIRYFNKLGKEEPSLREAMYLEGGAWHLPLTIHMWRENGAWHQAVSASGLYYPSQTVFMTIAMRGTAESFTAKLDQYDEEFTIKKETEQNDRRAFYGFILEKIRSHYKNMLRYIVEHGEVPRVLGQI